MLSIRLESLVKHIKITDKVIDIGCDHALLDIHLVKNNFLKTMIVSDVHENALKAGIENIEKNNLSKKIDARLGNGLTVLTEKDNIDTILISGMGTSTILKIVDHPYLSKINKLILQSNNDHYELRKRLIELGFQIKAEDFLIDNNKHYINIVFERGNKDYSKNEIKYGPILIHNKNYLRFELSNCERIKYLITKMKFTYRFRLSREIRLLNKLINESNK